MAIIGSGNRILGAKPLPEPILGYCHYISAGTAIVVSDIR